MSLKNQHNDYTIQLAIVKGRKESCRYCSEPAQTLHHVNEKQEDNRKSNLLPVCHKCHGEIVHTCDKPNFYTEPEEVVVEKKPGKGGPMPYHSCPSFVVCSAPKCPLDPEYHNRSNRLVGEEYCRATKATRLRIATANPSAELPYAGLTAREYSGSRSMDMVKSVRVKS